MSRNVKVVVVNVVQDGFVAGTVFGKLRLSLTSTADSSITFSSDVDDSNGQPSEFTFQNITEGSYIASAQRLDAGGNTLGATVTQSVDVVPVPATVSGPVPSTLTVTLE